MIDDCPSQSLAGSGSPTDLRRRRTRAGGLGAWSDEERTSVALGLLGLVCCFCLRLSDNGRGHVEPSLLLMRPQVRSSEQRQFEESFVEAVKLGSSLAESNNGGLKLGFAFCFLISRADAAWIGISQFPGHAQMSPQMVENFLKPALACEFLGTDFILVIDVILLNLDPAMIETASQQVRPSDIVLR